MDVKPSDSKSTSISKIACYHNPLKNMVKTHSLNNSGRYNLRRRSSVFKNPFRRSDIHQEYPEQFSSSHVQHLQNVAFDFKTKVSGEITTQESPHDKNNGDNFEDLSIEVDRDNNNNNHNNNILVAEKRSLPEPNNLFSEVNFKDVVNTSAVESQTILECCAVLDNITTLVSGNSSGAESMGKKESKNALLITSDHVNFFKFSESKLKEKEEMSIPATSNGNGKRSGNYKENYVPLLVDQSMSPTFWFCNWILILTKK